MAGLFVFRQKRYNKLINTKIMVINKRIVWLIIVLVLVSFTAAAFLLSDGKFPDLGRKTPRIYKIGVLNGFDFFGRTVDGFKAKMAELGYVDGENIAYDVQESNVDLDRYRSILQKFADDKVDLIFTFPTEASMEAKKIAQTTGIPVVFSNANIEGMNLVDSIREPGNNTTGVRYPGPDIALGRLEVMMVIVPDAKNILVPYDKNYPNVPPQLECCGIGFQLRE